MEHNMHRFMRLTPGHLGSGGGVLYSSYHTHRKALFPTTRKWEGGKRRDSKEETQFLRLLRLVQVPSNTAPIQLVFELQPGTVQ